MGNMIHTFTQVFETSSQEDWIGLVRAGLKGRRFEDALMRRTDDGIIRGPLSTLEDRPENPPNHIRKPDKHLDGRDWHIAAPVRDPDITYANGQALRDLVGGASALRLSLDASGAAGTAVRTVNDFKRVFEGVYIDLIPIALAPADNAKYAALLAANTSWHGLSVSLGMAPIAHALTHGKVPDLKNTGQAAIWANEHAPNWAAITINAAAIHEAGGTEAQELAFLASAGAAYIRALIQKGLSPDQAAKLISAELACDQDGHLGIAKLRAARKIWAQITTSFGCSEEAHSNTIHAVTSLRMMTKTDPWTNMLRIMAAGFGAVIGGADFVTTRPFTDALGLATPFGHRTARNMQLLMQEESHLGQVADPANGSYFHEKMTAELAQTAWALFQDLERYGGLEHENAHAYLTRRIKAANRQRNALIARQDKALLGVSLYPAQNPRPAELRRPPVHLKGSAAPLMIKPGFNGTLEGAQSGYALPAISAPLPSAMPPVRLSAPFEQLNATAAKPPLIVIALSQEPMANARLGFIKSYLKGGGIDVIILRPKTVLLPLQEAVSAASAPLVFFAGTDADYASMGKKVARALETVRGTKIWICAKPKVAADIPYAYGPIYNGQDRLGTLSEILGLMGSKLDV